MKQKIFSFLLVVVMIVACFPMRASAATIASGFAGPNANWSLDNGGHLKIYGSGLIGGPFISPIVITNEAPWGDYADQITSVTIGQGITAIDDGSFINLHKLCEVSIPASVTSIGSSVFWFCENSFFNRLSISKKPICCESGSENYAQMRSNISIEKLQKMPVRVLLFAVYLRPYP